ncbi:MAG: hypothetical protein LBT99_00595 [Bifidobacteriaceae bacterium]|jgi:hypothetical protein|nr:hypothetical protein [Bifidobacteriaceae bacterium]
MPFLEIITIVTVLSAVVISAIIGFLCFRTALALLKDPQEEALRKIKPFGLFQKPRQTQSRKAK